MSHNQRVLEALRTGPQTSHALYNLGLIAHSRISSLRAQGHVIECRRVPGEKRSSLAYEYTLVSSPLDESPRKPAPVGGIDGRGLSSSGGDPSWGAAPVATPPLELQLTLAVA